MQQIIVDFSFHILFFSTWFQSIKETYAACVDVSCSSFEDTVALGLVIY